MVWWGIDLTAAAEASCGELAARAGRRCAGPTSRKTRSGAPRLSGGWRKQEKGQKIAIAGVVIAVVGRAIFAVT